MKSPSTKSEEHLLSELEVSLPQTFSEALGIPDEVDNLILKTLTNIIHEEVTYNLRSGGKAGITKRFTPVARLKAMTDQLTHLFHKFSDKIKMFFAPHLCKSKGPASAPKYFASKVSITSPTSEVIKHEINNELSAIINPLLLDIPNSAELQEELSREIQEKTDGPGGTLKPPPHPQRVSVDLQLILATDEDACRARTFGVKQRYRGTFSPRTLCVTWRNERNEAFVPPCFHFLP
ncbi:hypothetical protein D4764_15G0004240 [Takifugu flavidus]|uniref:Uncharacterized protein n=1 Tax=Takifugu flavidus TaxID=433684 RepID=A0A5C6P492_9TELE|nr:hypothetical protein D4764_15G0004240 [Takifugu flavidus]